MPECQYCGKWFRSNKGLKTHITKMHTTKSPIGGRMTNISTYDPIGKMERRSKRAQRKKKNKKLFDW